MKRKNQGKHFALFGNPVGHSLSPRMHRAACEEMGLAARYESYRVENADEIVLMIKSLGIDGASITLPFKEAVIGSLDEVTESARTIGAVNTILNREDVLIGDNTDWIGLVRDLKDYMQIKGKTFAVLGAGGMARAAVFGLLQEGGIPVIFNRTQKRGAALARDFNSLSLPLEALDGFRAEALIQATPVGMSPNTDRSPLKREILANFRYVMDAIYNPLTTKLLRDAKEMGCLTINGVGLFVQQGAEQVRVWTGREPPLATMRQTVLTALREGAT